MKVSCALWKIKLKSVSCAYFIKVVFIKRKCLIQHFAITNDLFQSLILEVRHLASLLFYRSYEFLLRNIIHLLTENVLYVALRSMKCPF